MRTDDFDYYLPEELIAQTPLKDRSSSRLLIVDKENGSLIHEHFYNIVNYMDEGSVLVLNDTRVMPARLIGTKVDTNAIIELLLLKDLGDKKFECLAKPRRRLKIGSLIKFGNGELVAKVIALFDEGLTHVEFIYDGIFYEILDKLGEMPTPPYIHEKLIDKERYQTVYSKNIGSAAAPTAGLHFTNEVLEKIKNKNIEICFLTLHVGLGTFRPVSVEDVTKHKMHSEFYSLSKETAKILNKAKQENRKIIAVGTTTTRTLETVISKYNEFKECSGWTDIFIYPGYKFMAIDELITNFHLPKSTLIMLVSAFSSKEIILNAYNEAVKNKYRFFSFGDSMYLKKN